MSITKYTAKYDPDTGTHLRTVEYDLGDGTMMRSHRGSMSPYVLSNDVQYHATNERKNGGMEVYNHTQSPITSELFLRLREVCEGALNGLDQRVAATA